MNECMFAGKMCLTDCGEKNCALMVLILSMKNIAKLLVIRVDEGGGGGGRWTKKLGQLFKEHASIRQIVKFVMIVCPFIIGDISREGREEGLIHIKDFGFAPYTFSSPDFRMMFTENISQPRSKRVVWAGLKTRGRQCLNKMYECGRKYP